MSLLTDGLPDSIEIKGQAYKIQTSFKAWLKFYELVSLRDYTPETLAKILITVYTEKLPPTLDVALTEAFKFFSMYDDTEQKGKRQSHKKASFDFTQDAGSIYAAFRQQYGINLLDTELHWFEFRMLLDNLTDDTKLIKIIEYRSVDIAKIKDKETKKYYRYMKQQYRLKDTRTDEEREQDLAEAFFG